MAILVWILPKGYTWWAFSPLMPILVAEFASMQWLRKYTARPRAYRVRGLELVIVAVLLIILLVGFAFRLYGFESSEALGGASSVFVGAIAGGVAAAILTPKLMRKRRHDDFQRFDKEQEEE